MPDFQNPLPGVPWVESPFSERLFRDAPERIQMLARALHDDGFAVIDFPDAEFDVLAETICRKLAPAFDLERWRTHGHAQGSGLRLQDAWRETPEVLRVAANRDILDLLGKLYGRRAWPFQTLNFPVGTQQHFHSDAVHFSSIPERFMCGVWVALEDIDEDCGPLVYYPGSHKWPIYVNEHIGVCAATLDAPVDQSVYEAAWRALAEASGAVAKSFLPKRGQALIWAANLLHGGMPHRNPSRTRWSQVTHYYFDDCAYFTPMRSDFAFGNIAFRDLIDLSTGLAVEHRCAGAGVPLQVIERTRPHPGSLPDGFDAAQYYAANPDVKASGMPAGDHWLMYGRREGRRIRP